MNIDVSTASKRQQADKWYSETNKQNDAIAIKNKENRGKQIKENVKEAIRTTAHSTGQRLFFGSSEVYSSNYEKCFGHK